MDRNKKITALSEQDFREWCDIEIQRIIQIWEKESETEALQEFESLVQLCIRHKRWYSLKIAYGEWGIHYFHYNGNYIKALEKLELAHDIASQYQFSESIAPLCYWLSHCCTGLELYDDAVEWLGKGVEAAKQFNEHQILQGIVMTADIYYKNEAYKKSLEVLDHNKDSSKKAVSEDSVAYVNTLILYAKNNKELGNYTVALDYLGQADREIKKIMKNVNNIGTEDTYIIIQGEFLDIYRLLNTPEQAKKFAKIIINWLEQNTGMFERRCYYIRIILGRFLYQQKEYRKAAKYLEKNLKSNIKVFFDYDTCPYLMKCYTLLGEKDKLLQLIDKHDTFTKQCYDNIRSSQGFKYEYLRERHEAKVELNHQKKILKNVNDMNDSLLRFANIASHDLREPLRTIGSFSQLAKRALQKQEYDKLESYVDFIEQGAGSGQKLVSNLYIYAKQGFESLVVEEVDCQKLVELIVLQLNNQISRQEGKVEVGKLPVIRSVRSGLLLIFQNLISNALKFVPSEQQPLVKIDCRQDGETYHFTVSDNGIGIPEDKWADIFTTFTRLNGRQQYDGTGLGLATCKRVVDNLGGEISVQSEVSVGTTFTILLKEM